MVKSILIAMDGQQSSQAAVELGTRWAKAAGAMLVALGVIDEQAICGLESVPLGAGTFKEERDQALVERQRVRIEQSLAQFATHCANEQIRHKVLEEVGRAWEEICQQAQRFDLLLLGRPPSAEKQPHTEESLRNHVLAHSPRPVVIVPAGATESHRVLIAYDGSVPAARAVQLFVALGLPEPWEAHIVSIHESSAVAAERAALAADFLALHEYRWQVHAVASNHRPAEEILAASDRLGAGLIVMGSSGHRNWHKLLPGSVTQRVVRKSAVPVLLYH
jgi:nucleotide-binding universal stress UspA family protein